MKRVLASLIFAFLPLFVVAGEKEGEVIRLDVYKNAQCGCCAEWITHMQLQSFSMQTANLDHVDLSGKKADLGIKPEYQSCHTAVFENK